MDDFINSISTVFNILMNNQILGMPILMWALIIFGFTVVGKFIVGRK